MRLAGNRVLPPVPRRRACARPVPAHRAAEFRGTMRGWRGGTGFSAWRAGCATALRVVVLLAYQQALIFPDSERYLQYAQAFMDGHWSPDWLRTSGYSLLLIPAVLIRNLAVVAAVQHLLGLATAACDLRGSWCSSAPGAGWPRWHCVPVAVRPAPARHRAVHPHRRQRDVPARLALVVLVWKRAAHRQLGAGGGRAADRRRHGHQGIRPARRRSRGALPGGRLSGAGGAARPGRSCCCSSACCPRCSATWAGSRPRTGR